MNFNLNFRPDDIVLNLPNGEVITLQHSLLTATERAAVLELVDTSLSASMEFLFDKIINWTGVNNMSGQPIPLRSTDENGATASNIDKVFGQLGFDIHIEAWIKQLVMSGVPLSKLMGMAKSSLSDAQIEDVKSVAEKVGKTEAPSVGASSTD